MVTLYTWIPKPVEAVQAGILPDLGHSALAVGDTYISFWPEIDSPAGVIIRPFRPRVVRNPSSYVLESDPSGPYQQREADYQDPLDGLDEERMVARWNTLCEGPYDFTSMNCSHALLDILRSGLPEGQRESLDELDGAVENPDETGNHLEKVFRFLRQLVAAPVTDCTPESLRACALQLASVPDTAPVRSES